ncbi:hypothetical protein NPIRD3C_0775 [Nitrosopumilus piranensis]|uniref:Uncharacterized protein n=2 Tax=Nitrosopumilus piranensis TaxID=1582439 RepID=A0A0C5C9Z4_9ARCH|nr:hypothetical protein NPIRD3C_0775 [Nitrosopumilus piranensis]
MTIKNCNGVIMLILFGLDTNESQQAMGFFEQLTDNETTIKIITILAGNRTSLQFHEQRSEKW